MSNIHKQLKILINKFKNHDTYTQKKYESQKLQGNNTINKEISVQVLRIRDLQETIQTLITDGKRMSQYYEEIFVYMTHEFQSLKEQFEARQQSRKEESQQNKKHVQELQRKLSALKQQITQKQETLREVSYKYEELYESAAEVQFASSASIKDIETQLIQQSNFLQNQLHKTIKLFSEKSSHFVQLQEEHQALFRQYELLKDENEYLKNSNKRLFQQIQALKSQIQPQDSEFKIRIKDLNDQDYNLLEEKFKNAFKHKNEDQLENINYDEIIKQNACHQYSFTQQRQFLNISQHYCKSISRNRSLERSKFLQNCLEQLGPNPERQLTTKSSVRRLQAAIIQQQMFRNTIIQAKTQLQESVSQIEDPYKTFFSLLVQSEKLNSPYFNKISALNLTHLFQNFITQCIPYNKWQEHVKIELENNIKKSPKTQKTEKTERTQKTENKEKTEKTEKKEKEKAEKDKKEKAEKEKKEKSQREKIEKERIKKQKVEKQKAEKAEKEREKKQKADIEKAEKERQKRQKAFNKQKNTINKK